MSTTEQREADQATPQSLAAANEIADQFSPGFFDDRMVEDCARIIDKHWKEKV